MPKKKPQRRKDAETKKPRVANARRRLKVQEFLARAAPRVCGECEKPVGPAGALYARDPITGRQSSSVWCDDCYEKAVLAGQRNSTPTSMRKVA